MTGTRQSREVAEGSDDAGGATEAPDGPFDGMSGPARPNKNTSLGHSRGESFFKIGAEVGEVFDADRDAHQAVGDAVLDAQLLGNVEVRGRGRVQDERVHVAEGGRQGAEGKLVHAGDGGSRD